MENKNGNNGVIALLVVIIIIMGVSLFLSLNGTINFNKENVNSSSNSASGGEVVNDNKVSYSYKEMTGLYTYTSDTWKDELNGGVDENATYQLYLYENGTFVYKVGYKILQYEIGNYTINDNKIILNVLFTKGSGVGINKVSDEQLSNLIINSNAVLEDNNQNIKELNVTSITLNKTNNEDANKFLEENDIYKILNE